MTTHERIDADQGNEEGAEAPASEETGAAAGSLPAEGEAVDPAVAEARARAGAAEAKAAVAEEQAARAHDRWLRAQAELDNVRKRTARELAEGLKYANEQLVKELLPVLDNLERAIVAAGGAVPTAGEPGAPAEGEAVSPGVRALRDGVALTRAQFLGALRKFGVEPVEAVGRPFDPTLHEAVQQVESDRPAGTIVAEYQRGYLLNGRLVRPAMVGVAAPAGEQGGAASG